MGISSNGRKLISIVIPVFNCERYLAVAVESGLRQSYKRVEIIVVDDGSTDMSGKIARGFSTAVTYVLTPHGGVAAARNKGIAVARGSFFAFLDADDVWAEDKLMLQMRVFEQNPDVDMVFGHVRQFISEDIELETGSRISIPRPVMPGYVPSTVLVRRESFFRVGFFRDTWQVGEFIDWYLMSKEQGLKSVMMNDIVSKRRIHDDNTGIRMQTSKTDYVRILKSSLDRRRRRQEKKQEDKC
jgi:glycosyltransferase involved in cell wall biosynthesis